MMEYVDSSMKLEVMSLDTLLVLLKGILEHSVSNPARSESSLPSESEEQYIRVCEGKARWMA